MSKTRLEMIDRAFKKMDKTGDGIVTVEDLKLAYDVSQHPKYLSGEQTADQLLKKFLNVFQCGDTDDKVVHYNCMYESVSLLIRHRTCDVQVAGSSPGWAKLRSGLGQATYTCVPLSLSSII